MPTIARTVRVTSLAVAAIAASALFGCEPTQTIDSSQVRPTGSAPSEAPGHSVKFDSNKTPDAPAGDATPK
ncbi:MAG: hypothetical protein RLY21_1667 [Planctomycetota bacterium]|jgi:hypothetical protein